MTSRSWEICSWRTSTLSIISQQRYFWIMFSVLLIYVRLRLAVWWKHTVPATSIHGKHTRFSPTVVVAYLELDVKLIHFKKCNWSHLVFALLDYAVILGWWWEWYVRSLHLHGQSVLLANRIWSSAPSVPVWNNYSWSQVWICIKKCKCPKWQLIVKGNLLCQILPKTVSYRRRDVIFTSVRLFMLLKIVLQKF